VLRDGLTCLLCEKDEAVKWRMQTPMDKDFADDDSKFAVSANL
jgi:hypothetical protein